jgi:phosphotransferase system HPr (HPr) family protein
MMMRSRNSNVRVTKELTVLNQHGLHARPASEFVRCAIAFESELYIETQGKRFHAKRIIDVLLANLNCGSTFTLEAIGHDANEAVARFEKLLLQFKEADDQTANHTAPAEKIPD